MRQEMLIDANEFLNKIDEIPTIPSWIKTLIRCVIKDCKTYEDDLK